MNKTDAASGRNAMRSAVMYSLIQTRKREKGNEKERLKSAFHGIAFPRCMCPFSNMPHIGLPNAAFRTPICGISHCENGVFGKQKATCSQPIKHQSVTRHIIIT